MNSATREQLDREILAAKSASDANELFIAAHITAVRAEIFMAFEDLSSDDIEGLKKVKNLQVAISALEDSVSTIIDTGKLAAKQLADEEIEEKEDE